MAADMQGSTSETSLHSCPWEMFEQNFGLTWFLVWAEQDQRLGSLLKVTSSQSFFLFFYVFIFFFWPFLVKCVLVPFHMEVRVQGQT